MEENQCSTVARVGHLPRHSITVTCHKTLTLAVCVTTASANSISLICQRTIWKRGFRKLVENGVAVAWSFWKVSSNSELGEERFGFR